MLLCCYSNLVYTLLMYKVILYIYLIDKKIQRIKTAPVEVEKEGDDAAGFRKPLRFRCISCDKPVGLKPNK